MKFNILLVIIVLMPIVACQQQPRQVAPAFYHWQTKLSLTKIEDNYLKQLNVQKLYVKFFDVDWNSQNQSAVPLAMLEVEPSDFLDSLQIIPTIFITNRTLVNIKDEDLPPLARNIYIKITELARPLPQADFSEVQFDCDWTQSTKGKYFELLKLIKQELKAEQRPILLSATIRLHQIKFYYQTGVPPVDRGMLMFYNTGNLNDWETENSILQMETAQQYLVNFENYPLPLDVALPIFSWGVLYRNGKMIKLLNNLRAEQLETDQRLKKLTHNRFEVIKSGYLDGYYLYEEDLIRTEKIDSPKLKKSADLLRDAIQNTELSLAFYHLDTMTIKHYPYAQLEAVYHTFH